MALSINYSSADKELIRQFIQRGDVPCNLYKYRTVNSAEHLLMNHSIYFSCYKDFNDPFESAFNTLEEYTPQQYYNSFLSLVDKGFVIATSDKSKAKEYRVETNILCGSNYKGTASLKRIESYRLRELVMEDLRIYQPCSISDIHERIGKEIPLRKLQFQIKQLLVEGRIGSEGQKRWTKYRIKT